MTNVISNICAIASAIVNIHISTNLQSLVQEDMQQYWITDFRERDGSRNPYYMPTLFIDPWFVDMPDIGLHRVPRAHMSDTSVEKHPTTYPCQ